MRDSDFFFGQPDTLTIGPFYERIPFDMNPVLVIAFVENILGYHLVQSAGTYWVYKSVKVV